MKKLAFLSILCTPLFASMVDHRHPTQKEKENFNLQIAIKESRELGMRQAEQRQKHEEEELKNALKQIEEMENREQEDRELKEALRVSEEEEYLRKAIALSKEEDDLRQAIELSINEENNRKEKEEEAFEDFITYTTELNNYRNFSSETNAFRTEMHKETEKKKEELTYQLNAKKNQWKEEQRSFNTAVEKQDWIKAKKEDEKLAKLLPEYEKETDNLKRKIKRLETVLNY